MILDRIQAIARDFPEKTALMYEGRVWSYRDLLKEIGERMGFLSHAGIKSLGIEARTEDALFTFLGATELGVPAVILPGGYAEEDRVKLRSSYGMSFYESGNLEVYSGESDTRMYPGGQIGILSSGSTGEPRIIWKTTSNWEKAFPHQSSVFGISAADRLFVLDTLAYSANLNALIHILWQGGTAILGSLGRAADWGRQLEASRVTSVFLVPSHARLLAKSARNFAGVKSFVTAGEKLDPGIAGGLLEKFPEATLTEYYGAAELGHISFQQNREIIDHPLSVGKAFPDVKIEVNEGEILVFSPYVAPDYAANGSVKDLGELSDGRLTLFGRSGRMFNRRGLNIYAAEIENKALQCGLILEAVLVAVPGINGAEKLLLLVVPKEKEDEPGERLMKYLLEKLPKAKVPNKIVVLDELPHSDSGKVDFRALSKINEREQITT